MDNWAMLMLLLALVAVQDILTGVFGAPSIVATMIASKAINPRQSILLSALAQLIGPFLFGVAVASTIGSEVVDASGVTPGVVFAALGATIFWMLFTWLMRIPCSSTHALIGGLIGAISIAMGPEAIHMMGLAKILLTLTLTAPLAVVVAYIVTRICHRFVKDETPLANERFNKGQKIASLVLGLAVGSSNAQNAMGVTALGLVATGMLPRFEIPIWVIIISAACLALGNLIGGMRLIRSVGTQFFSIRPIHGFGAELSSATIILASSLAGGGVSTTHITNMSIVGAGAAESFADVKWVFVRKVVITWLVTIPFAAVLSALMYLALRQLGIG